ncbi:hypothetical protein [Streptomyces sp. NPDC060322]|uniref:hypothetical protein n=1 Tax=unclassified Streptomyces TaxID=2593676 RepID=UPI00365DE737
MHLSQTSTAPALGGSRWNTFPSEGAMTARQFFAGAEPLLQGVIDDNALREADGDVLEAQIRATLALGTRETSLPLAVGPDSSSAARELGAQAETIGREIASWSVAALRRLLADPIPLPAGPLVVRSHCYGHLLTHPATDLLMGRRGGPVTIQLYNEWIHQMVLLRDALLPFTNWQEVPLRVTPEGLRPVEQGRDRFLTELLVRRIRHTTVVDFARHVVTGGSGPAGYGFDHEGGTALPAVLDGEPLTAPRHLLTWRPSAPAAASEASEGTTTYVAEAADYYTEPRTPAADLPSGAGEEGRVTGRVVTGPAVDGTRTARIEVTLGDRTAHADLGQALRGHRFARPAPAPGTTTAGAARTAGLWAVLGAPGLVWTQDDDVTVDATGQDGLVALALLGRLYPENVFLRSAGRLPGPAAGGEGPGRVTVDLPAR